MTLWVRGLIPASGSWTVGGWYGHVGRTILGQEAM